MVTALTLWEIAVNDRDIAKCRGHFRHDDTALRFFIVPGEAATHGNRGFFSEQRDAIVTFLTVVEDVVTQFRDFFEGEHVVVNLGLLQADNIGLMLLNNGFQLMRTGAQAVDIKRDKFHSRCQCKVNSAWMVAEFASTVTGFDQ